MLGDKKQFRLGNEKKKIYVFYIYFMWLYEMKKKKCLYLYKSISVKVNNVFNIMYKKLIKMYTVHFV